MSFLEVKGERRGVKSSVQKAEPSSKLPKLQHQQLLLLPRDVKFVAKPGSSDASCGVRTNSSKSFECLFSLAAPLQRIQQQMKFCRFLVFFHNLNLDILWQIHS